MNLSVSVTEEREKERNEMEGGGTFARGTHAHSFLLHARHHGTQLEHDCTIEC